MRSILVLGGTLFFGKQLVERLLARGDRVTIATRGQAEDGFGDRVRRIVTDRRDAERLRADLAQGEWDVVYDQIGYDSKQARGLIEAVSGRLQKLIFMSSGAVYEPRDAALEETEFDPETYELEWVDFPGVNYGEGKRQAETAYVQLLSVPVVCVRYPIVIGRDDYTRRLAQLIEKIRSGAAIRIPNPDAMVSLVRADDGARLLEWVGETDFTGPANGASGALRFRDLCDLIARETGGESSVELGEEAREAFDINHSSHLSTELVQSRGFEFQSLEAEVRALSQVAETND